MRAFQLFFFSLLFGVLIAGLALLAAIWYYQTYPAMRTMLFVAVVLALGLWLGCSFFGHMRRHEKRAHRDDCCQECGRVEQFLPWCFYTRGNTERQGFLCMDCRSRYLAHVVEYAR